MPALQSTGNPQFIMPSLPRFILIFFFLFLALQGHAAEKVVTIFILAGQSNMEGHGRIAGNQKGTLESLIRDPATASRYRHLHADGNWITRKDVWISWLDRSGNLGIGGWAAKGAIGPELGFGWTVGDHIEEPILLLKFGPGGTSLAGPWRPPSAGPHRNGKPRGQGIGDQFDNLVSSVKQRLKNLESEFPSLAGYRTNLAGFGWHQGWNDGCSKIDSVEYESNLAHLIRDMRNELNSPQLPFVIAGSGFGGWDQKIDRRLMIMKAQEAVTGYDEFKETTRYVETRGFFRDGPISPRPIRYHWCCNAETYWLIGEHMGHAMVELLGGKKAPGIPGSQSN